MEREIPEELTELVRIARLLAKLETYRVDSYRMLREHMPEVEGYLPRDERETVEPRRAEVVQMPEQRSWQSRLTAADRKMLRDFGIR